MIDYKLSQNKIAIDGNEENFPYPIKIWNDNTNIYIKPLRIPKQNKLNIECKRALDKGVDFDFGYNNHCRLYLCLEIEDSRTRGTVTYSNIYRALHGTGMTKNNRPTKGGKWFCANGSMGYSLLLFPEEWELGNIYSHPIISIMRSNSFINRLIYLRDEGDISSDSTGFFKVRATYRYGGNYPYIGRTGINSNILKIFI